MLAIRFVLYIFGFNQGALCIGEDEGNEFIIMINDFKQAAVRQSMVSTVTLC
jgi:hypothetical protein